MENNVLDTIKSRRSVRKFKSEQISESELNAILEAGTYAPTGRNRQSPIIVAVQNREDIDYMRRLNAKIMGDEEADPFYNAPTVLVVLADREAPTYIYDGSLVMGTLMLAAHSVGVDSCWIHRAKELFDSSEGKELLKKWGIEGDYEGIGNCILGYRDCPYPETRPRKEGYIRKVL